MMKKFYVMLAVAALVLVSSMAFAADVTVGGSVDIRSRDFKDLDLVKSNGAGSEVDTQERVRLDVSVKAGDVKGKIQIENDYDTWGRLEQPQGDDTTKTSNTNGDNAKLDVREAWLLFPLPGTPVNVKGGHMFLQLGNGWFFRSNKYGSDAWVAYTDIDNLHLGIIDVKVSEGATSASDDIDAYVFLATMKINENNKVGIDFTNANDRRASISDGWPIPNPYKQILLQNLGLNYNGVIGPVNLQAEVDVQMGKATADGVVNTTDSKFKGTQVVVQGNVKLEPVTVNFTVASGSGQKYDDSSSDIKQFVPILDADMHYTFLYEYKIANKGAVDLLKGTEGGKNLGFANTTAISVGAMFAATNTLSVGADLWFLQATEKVYDQVADDGSTTSELGTEVDVKINWKLADNVSWNWTLGYLDPGKGLGKDPATGAQGVLSMKF